VIANETKVCKILKNDHFHVFSVTHMSFGAVRLKQKWIACNQLKFVHDKSAHLNK